MRDTVFLAQPMLDKNYEELFTDRKIKTRELERMGYIVINPGLVEDVNICPKALVKTLNLLVGADCAYFLKGWKFDKLCAIANAICAEYGIKAYYEDPSKE